MIVKESSNYGAEFPEHFTWGHLDSLQLASLGSIISADIMKDLQTPDRLYVPGLRKALNYIAEIARV